MADHMLKIFTNTSSWLMKIHHYILQDFLVTFFNNCYVKINVILYCTIHDLFISHELKLVLYL